MYRNIGKKIQAIAKVYAWLGIIFSVICALVMIFGQTSGVQMGITGRIVMGIFIAVAGSVVSWISSWLVYGFGELIENTKKIAEKN